jgi:hypothetical protein
MPATYEDAQLMMQIVRWGTEMGLEDAMSVIWAEDFEPDSAEMSNPAVGKVLGYGEFLGTFVKQGILDRGLVIDMWWVEGIWARVGPAALKLRANAGEPRLYENFEALATSA